MDLLGTGIWAHFSSVEQWDWQKQRPFLLCWEVTNKHLITGPKGNSEFCFPEMLHRLGGGILQEAQH